MLHKVLLVDDHPLFRVGLRQILENSSDVVVIAEVDTPEKAMQCFADNEIDLIITDLSLQNDSGVSLISKVRELDSNCPILVLSMHDELIWAERLIQEGANGYLMKDSDISVIQAAIDSVLAGNVFLSFDVQQQILQGLSGHMSNNISVSVLSNREREIFQCMGRHLSTTDIAKRLFISVKTVQTHQANIKQKLHISSLEELRTLAIQYAIP